MSGATAVPAGPKLDALVCEAVGIAPTIEYLASHNGGESSMYWSDFRGDVEQFIADYRARMPDSLPARCEVVEYKRYPPVSRDMGAAWRVLTSRPVGVWSPSLVMQDDGAWWCGLNLGYNTSYDRDCGHLADTAPLAICRAALAAVEKA